MCSRLLRFAVPGQAMLNRQDSQLEELFWRIWLMVARDPGKRTSLAVVKLWPEVAEAAGEARGVVWHGVDAARAAFEELVA